MRLGITIGPELAERARHVPAAIERVAWEPTFRDPPRAPALRRVHDDLARKFPNAAPVAYAWHLVTHGPGDHAVDQAARTLPGPAHAFGHVQPTREVAQAWEISLGNAHALQATTMVLRTPSSFTPGVVARKRLADFVSTHRQVDITLVWEPTGLWQPLEIAQVCTELKLVPFIDAFSDARFALTETDLAALESASPDVWLRIDGAGRRRTFTPEQHDILRDLESDAFTAIFGGTQAIANATRFAEL